MFSMKTKIRKSQQPSNNSNSTRVRQKFLTGVKKQDTQRYQLNIKNKNLNQHGNTLNHGQHLNQQIVSDSIITAQQQDYSNLELMRAFDFIADKKQYITPQDLAQFLNDQKQEQFKKYEMIRMLDREGKGYITRTQFIQFYEQNIIADQNQQKLPETFVDRMMWKQAIQQNYELFQNLKDKEYCMFVANQLKKLRDNGYDLDLPYSGR